MQLLLIDMHVSFNLTIIIAVLIFITFSDVCRSIGKLVLTPRYGSELGGTPIIVTGDKLTAYEEDNVTCVFDGIETDGFVTKDGQVFCVSPEMSRTGRLPFRLHIEGDKTSFTGVTIFISGGLLSNWSFYLLTMKCV